MISHPHRHSAIPCLCGVLFTVLLPPVSYDRGAPATRFIFPLLYCALYSLADVLNSLKFTSRSFYTSLHDSIARGGRALFSIPISLPGISVSSWLFPPLVTSLYKHTSHPTHDSAPTTGGSPLSVRHPYLYVIFRGRRSADFSRYTEICKTNCWKPLRTISEACFSRC